MIFELGITLSTGINRLQADFIIDRVKEGV